MVCASAGVTRGATFGAHGPQAREPEDPPLLRILSSLALCLLLATPAAAQLASQTGLVGNVTDAGGGVLPGAVGDRRQRRHAGDPRRRHQRGGRLPVQRRAARPLRDHHHPPGLPDVQGDQHRGRRQPGGAPGRRVERRRAVGDGHRWRPPTPRSRPTGPRCRRPSRRAPWSTCRRAAATCGSWRRPRPACCVATPPTSACPSAAPASARSRTA